MVKAQCVNAGSVGSQCVGRILYDPCNRWGRAKERKLSTFHTRKILILTYLYSKKVVLYHLFTKTSTLHDSTGLCP